MPTNQADRYGDWVDHLTPSRSGGRKPERFETIWRRPMKTGRASRAARPLEAERTRRCQTKPRRHCGASARRTSLCHRFIRALRGPCKVFSPRGEERTSPNDRGDLPGSGWSEGGHSHHWAGRSDRELVGDVCEMPPWASWPVDGGCAFSPPPLAPCPGTFPRGTHGKHATVGFPSSSGRA